MVDKILYNTRPYTDQKGPRNFLKFISLNDVTYMYLPYGLKLCGKACRLVSDRPFVYEKWSVNFLLRGPVYNWRGEAEIKLLPVGSGNFTFDM